MTIEHAKLVTVPLKYLLFFQVESKTLKIIRQRTFDTVHKFYRYYHYRNPIPKIALKHNVLDRPELYYARVQPE